MDVNVLAQWATVVAGGTALGTFFNIYLLPKIIRFWKMLTAGAKVETQLTHIEGLLGDVMKELKPNGGSSLRDSLDRVEKMGVIGEQRQRALMENAMQGVFETDEDGEVIYTNRTLTVMTGRVPDELLGSGWYNIIDHETRAQVSQSFRNAVAHHREWESEFDLVTVQGDVHRVVCHALRYNNAKNDTIGYLASIVYAGTVAHNGLRRRKEDHEP